MSNKSFNKTLNQLISGQGETVHDEVIFFIPMNIRIIQLFKPASPPPECLPLPPSNWYSVPHKDPS